MIDKLTQPPAVTLHLPRCNRYFGACSELGQCRRVVLMQGLFKPEQIAVFDCSAKQLRLDRIEHVVRIDNDVDAVSDGSANRANALSIFTPSGASRHHQL